MVEGEQEGCARPRDSPGKAPVAGIHAVHAVSIISACTLNLKTKTGLLKYKLDTKCSIIFKKSKGPELWLPHFGPMGFVPDYPID